MSKYSQRSLTRFVIPIRFTTPNHGLLGLHWHHGSGGRVGLIMAVGVVITLLVQSSLGNEQSMRHENTGLLSGTTVRKTAKLGTTSVHQQLAMMQRNHASTSLKDKEVKMKSMEADKGKLKAHSKPSLRNGNNGTRKIDTKISKDIEDEIDMKLKDVEDDAKNLLLGIEIEWDTLMKIMEIEWDTIMKIFSSCAEPVRKSENIDWKQVKNAVRTGLSKDLCKHDQKIGKEDDNKIDKEDDKKKERNISELPPESFLQTPVSTRSEPMLYTRGKSKESKSSGTSLVSLQEDVENARVPLEKAVSGETPSKKLIQTGTAQSEKLISDCTTRGQKTSSFPALLSKTVHQITQRLYCCCLGKKKFGNKKTSNSKETKNPMTENQAIRAAQRLFVLWLLFFLIEYAIAIAESFAIYYFESYKKNMTCMDLTLLSFQAFVFFFTATVSLKLTAENMQRVTKEIQSTANMNGELYVPGIFRYYSATVFTDICSLLSVFWVFYSSGAAELSYGGDGHAAHRLLSFNETSLLSDPLVSFDEEISESAAAADTSTVPWFDMLSRSFFGRLMDCDALAESALAESELHSEFGASEFSSAEFSNFGSEFSNFSSELGQEESTIFDGAKIVGIIGTIVFLLEIWTMFHLWVSDNIAKISRKFAIRGSLSEREGSALEKNFEKDKGKESDKGNSNQRKENLRNQREENLNRISSQSIREDNSAKGKKKEDSSKKTTSAEGTPGSSYSAKGTTSTLDLGNLGSLSTVTEGTLTSRNSESDSDFSDIITKNELMKIVQEWKKWKQQDVLGCPRGSQQHDSGSQQPDGGSQQHDGGSQQDAMVVGRKKTYWPLVFQCLGKSLGKKWRALRSAQHRHKQTHAMSSMSSNKGDDDKSKDDFSPTLLSVLLAVRCEEFQSAATQVGSQSATAQATRTQSTTAQTFTTSTSSEAGRKKKPEFVSSEAAETAQIKAAETALIRMFGDGKKFTHDSSTDSEGKNFANNSKLANNSKFADRKCKCIDEERTCMDLYNQNQMYSESIEKFLTSTEKLINKSRSDMALHYWKQYLLFALPHMILYRIPREILIILAPWFHEFFLTQVDSTQKKNLLTFVLFFFTFLLQLAIRRMEYLYIRGFGSTSLHLQRFFAGSEGIPLITPLIPIILRGGFDFFTFMIKLVFYYVPSLSLEGPETAFLMIAVRSGMKVLLLSIGILRWRVLLWKREKREGRVLPFLREKRVHAQGGELSDSEPPSPKEDNLIRCKVKLCLSRILEGFIWTMDQIENVCGIFGETSKKEFEEKRTSTSSQQDPGNSTNQIARRFLVDVITKPLWPELLSASDSGNNSSNYKFFDHSSHHSDHHSNHHSDRYDNESDNPNESKKREEVSRSNNCTDHHTNCPKSPLEALLSVERSLRLLVEAMDRKDPDSVSTKKKDESQSSARSKKSESSARSKEEKDSARTKAQESARQKNEELKSILAGTQKGPTLKESVQEWANDVGHFFGCVCILKADPLLNVNDKNGRQQEGRQQEVTEVSDSSPDDNSTLGLSDNNSKTFLGEHANHLSSAVAPLVGAAELLLSKRAFENSRDEHHALLESVAAKLTIASQSLSPYNLLSVSELRPSPMAEAPSSFLKSAASRLEEAAGGFRKLTSVSDSHSSNFNLPTEEHDTDAATLDAAYHVICGASSLLSKSCSSTHVLHLLKTAAELLQMPRPPGALGTSQFELHGVSVIPPVKSTFLAAPTKVSSGDLASGASAATKVAFEPPLGLATAVPPIMAAVAVPAARTLLSSAALLSSSSAKLSEERGLRGKVAATQQLAAEKEK